MEVIYSYVPPDTVPSRPSSSSLDYRGLDPQSELALSVDHAAFVGYHGGSEVTPQGARRSPARTFAPLTPIIASPITTPTTSMSTNTIYLGPDKEGAKERLTALQRSSQHETDYSTKGNLPKIPLSEEQFLKIIDKSPTWTSTPPTPPPKPPSYQSAARCAPSAVPLSVSLPVSLNPRPLSSRSNVPRRRASLPPMALSKPLPPTPYSHASPVRIHQHWPPLFGGPDGIVEPAVNSGRSSKPIFHVLDNGSDREEDGNGELLSDSPKEVLLEQRREATTSDDGWLTAKKHDDIRRYHALTELLTTEEGYFNDLRELVNGYIRQLPVLSCRPVANSSSNISISPFIRSPTSSTILTSALSSNSRTPSFSQLPLASQNLPLHPSESQGTSKDKNATRYMFSDNEIELVTRNIEEILSFHEAFIDELRTALIPLGFSMFDGPEAGGVLHTRQKEGIGPPEYQLEEAITVVSKTFTRRAARFDLYQSFCAGHSEAFDVVRKMQRVHSVEWDAFEQSSSQLIIDLRKPGSYASTAEGRASTLTLDKVESFEAHKKRRHSLSSLDGPARSLRLPNMRSSTNLKHAATSPPDAGAGGGKNSRLAFMDYLIKPVQRICRYPLLLDQLKMGKSFRENFQGDGSGSSSWNDFAVSVDVNAVVENASQVMRDVASSVDEARRRQDILTKSTLIATRISAAQPSARGLVGHNLSSTFLSSLGACLLAGSMDVIHHYIDKVPGNSGTLKAKYLGGFLYLGGYLILVKVCKGKVYEPRHWFSLDGVELVDVPEQALLPCSFRLTCKGHCFDLAVACEREKDVWISAFRESLTFPPSWSNEPVSSLQAHGRSDFHLSMTDDGPNEGIPPVPPLPTIQSIPELEGGVDALLPAVIRLGATLPRMPRPDSVNLSLPPSRRSSTASVMAIFSSASDSTMLIRRSSPAARLSVERGLLDVFSDLCLTARFHAGVHEEELFQAPKFTRPGFSKSGSGLGMAGMGVAAKDRLTKRESVLVQRRMSGVDGYTSPVEGDCRMELLMRTSTTTSLTSRRRAKKLKIVSVPLPLGLDGEGGSGGVSPSTPPALSQCSSITASNPSSVPGSPVTAVMPLRNIPIRVNTAVPRPDLLVVRGSDYRPKRSRSMVDNMKSIFQSRSASPASSLSGEQSLPPPEDPRPQWNTGINAGLFKRLSGTLRRRVNSAPDIPEETPSFTSGTLNSALNATSTPPIAVHRNKTTKDRRPVFLSTSESGQLRAYTAPAVTTSDEAHFQQTSSPARRRSLFSSSISRRHTTTDEFVPSLRLQRNFSFLQRLSPLNSTSHTETA